MLQGNLKESTQMKSLLPQACEPIFPTYNHDVEVKSGFHGLLPHLLYDSVNPNVTQ